ncbi:MAG: hypothetical protein EAZ09_24585 [Oscillatoriales cyanobacterium]|nr:MAG: hypothetical protein EAZ18_22010 [Oscillatoriales cyanobacterium]TAH15333.1 MAG: hypothetical protein EAZ09_24585 [Oscillatoriales cyanobacterium]
MYTGTQIYGVPPCSNSRVFAKKLGLSVKTLQRWDVSGKLPAKRKTKVSSNHAVNAQKPVRIEQSRNTVLRSNNAFIHQNKAKTQQKSNNGYEQTRWHSEVYL